MSATVQMVVATVFGPVERLPGYRAYSPECAEDSFQETRVAQLPTLA